jgi:dinuclear metal center YbgI/SA1388 family protein
MLLVRNILCWLDDFAPFRFAESWDHCGLQVGDPEASLERILVALDPCSQTIREAERLKCQCMVTHHPIIHRPLNAVRMDEHPGRLVAEALMKGISMIAVHTNLDAACQGTNDHLARLLALDVLEPLEADAGWKQEQLYGGMGRVGLLSRPVSLGEMVEATRGALGGIGVRVVGNREKVIQRVAVCSGSGGSLVERVIATGSDAYVTGDIKYHEAQRAVEADLALIDIGHFASERIIVKPLVDYLTAKAAVEGSRLEVFAATEERDPFWICC